MQNTPKVFKAILTSVLGSCIFFLSYLLSYLIVGGILYLLSEIPIIGNLVDLLFYFRGDSPDLMLSLLCPAVAYGATIITQEFINNDAPTRGLSCLLIGVGIVLLQVICLVLNLYYGEGVWTNIVLIITGAITSIYGWREMSK